jgi:hypothetical protein
MPPLILKRARIGSNVEDFDVLENGVVVYLYVAHFLFLLAVADVYAIAAVLALARETLARRCRGRGSGCAVSAEPFLVHQGTQSCEAELIRTRRS